jgi:hypothetical protein
MKTKKGLRFLCDRCYSPMKSVIARPIGNGAERAAQCVDPSCGRFYSPTIGYANLVENRLDHDPDGPRCHEHGWMGVLKRDPKSVTLHYVCHADGCEKNQNQPAKPKASGKWAQA